jgi:hypothetical protein
VEAVVVRESMCSRHPVLAAISLSASFINLFKTVLVKIEEVEASLVIVRTRVLKSERSG